MRYLGNAKVPAAIILSISINISPNVLNFLLQSLKTALTQAGKLADLFAVAGSGGNIVEKQRGTVQDCRELHERTVSSLKKSVSRISSSPDAKKIADAKAFLSAALTNKATCLEGLESSTGPMKTTLVGSIGDTYKHVANSLSALAQPGRAAKKSGGDNGGGRRLMSADFPGWLSGKDRRILDDYYNDYDQKNLVIPGWKPNIVLLGDGSNVTTITGNRSNVGGWTTFRSATVAVSGDGFLARDIAFENTAGPENHQAVALRINADLAAVYKCTIAGFQDSLYVHSFRQFYRECDIYGTIDYIFGNAAAVFQGCNIVSRMPMPGQFTVVTAQSRGNPFEVTGIAIQNCSILATYDLYNNSNAVKSYLGRPWQNYSVTVYIESYIDDFIAPEGWTNWVGDDGLDTLYYGEYQNNGPGSGTENRVGWAGFHVMDYNDALNYTVSEFITGDEWLDSTSFPYDDGYSSPTLPISQTYGWPWLPTLQQKPHLPTPFSTASLLICFNFSNLPWIALVCDPRQIHLICRHAAVVPDMAFQDFDLISERRKAERKKKLQRRIAIAVVLILILLVAVGAAVVYFVVMKKDDGDKKSRTKSKTESSAAKAAEKSVRSLCHGTDFEETCERTLSKTVEDDASAAKKPKELLRVSMVATETEIDKAVKKSGDVKGDTPQKKAAIKDCADLLQDAKDDLDAAIASMKGDDIGKGSSHADDLHNWLSAVITYQDTCVDGFPDGEEKTAMEKTLKTAKELGSNSLAIVSQLASVISTFESPKRRLLADGSPEWMNDEKRRMLKANIPEHPNVTVAKDGSGKFRTINAALKALPATYKGRYVIFIKEGIYDETVLMTQKMVNITMCGEGSQKTIITGKKNFVDGVTTYQSATFAVLGEGFMAQSIGFQNTAGPAKRQAVALRVESDKSVFLNCRMEGYQNTLYVHTHRQFYRGCYITGTVDFIFGNAAAIFQNCEMVVRKPLAKQQNTVTAQGRTDKRQTTGIVLQNCQIMADDHLVPDKAKFKSYLGRPWKEYSRTIIMETEIGDLIDPEGWTPWSGKFALKTLYYAEFQNTGPGSTLLKRVKWPGYQGAIKIDEATRYTVVPFIQGDTWVKALDCPVRLGLTS
nr:putative pectinesterase/pectinesterase inhibitor 45 [Ipomoea batatas]